MHVSDEGRKFIESKEGCRLHAYMDIVGVWTIGYGCTGPNIVAGMTITQEQADQMLNDRLAQEFEPGVVRLIGSAPTTQGQFDAMVSLAFNIGMGAFARSSVLRDHINKDYACAADAFSMWDKAGGREVQALLDRREEEADMYYNDSPEDA